jgi:hypothetical protein
MARAVTQVLAVSADTYVMKNARAFAIAAVAIMVIANPRGFAHLMAAVMMLLVIGGVALAMLPGRR